MLSDVALICTPGREASSKGRPRKSQEIVAEGGRTRQCRLAMEPRLWTREAGSERKDGYWADWDTESSRFKSLAGDFTANVTCKHPSGLTEYQ